MNKENQKNIMVFLASIIWCRQNIYKKMIRKIENKLKIQCYVNIKIIKN